MNQTRVVDYAKIGYSVVEIPICQLNRKFLSLKKSQLSFQVTGNLTESHMFCGCLFPLPFDAFLISYPNNDNNIKDVLHLQTPSCLCQCTEVFKQFPDSGITLIGLILSVICKETLIDASRQLYGVYIRK